MTADDRRRRLAAALPEPVEAMLLTSPVSIRWASGFSGSFGALLVGRDPGAEPVLASDGRYRLRVATEAPQARFVLSRQPAAELIREAGRRGWRQLGIEPAHLTLAAHAALTDVAATERVQLHSVPAAVERLRMVKDPDEIDLLRRACAATDAAYTEVLPRLRVGVTEREVEGWLLAALRAGGAQACAFDPIVASGPHAAIPHHQPTDRPLAPGDLVTVDFGGAVGGQHADFSRTVVVGPAGEWQRDLYRLVAGIQAACRERVRPGAVPATLDDLAAAAIRDAGHEPAHGLGHGVGLEIHEEPFLTPGSASPALAERMTVTVEPGVYVEGRGGVRIEDTVVVTATGHEPLTTSPRDLVTV